MVRGVKFWVSIMSIALLAGCKDAGIFELERKNLLLTGTATNIKPSSATLSGELLDVNITGEKVIQHGHCWAFDNPNPTIENNKTELGETNKAGVFQSEATNLRSETLYYMRAYLKTNTQVLYGSVNTFNTTQLFNYTTLPTTNITQTTATLRSNINMEGVSLLKYGHCWSTKRTVTKEENEGISDYGTLSNSTTFTTLLTGLKPNTTYYFVTYLVGQDGFTYYTPLSQFTTAP